jgi:hypothetical protein
VLFEHFGELEITAELHEGDLHAFFWRASLTGRVIEGADLLRHDQDGRIAEITVLVRPLVSLAVFASAIGPSLAARRSPMRGALVRALTMPLRGVFAIADFAASALIGLR